jgi:alanine racemase
MATPLPPDGFADRPRLQIDLTALAANYTILQKASGKAQCAAVVKADAYGLGMDETVPVLLAAGCRHFFVAQLAEGVRLRHIISTCAESDKSFDASAIYVLSGLAANAENDYVTHRLHPCLISLAQIKNWQAHCRKAGNHPAALFLDTGFNRLGLSFDDIAEMSETNEIFEGWTLDLIASHLACADTPDHPMNRAQLEAFHTMTALLPPAPRSLANTGGIFLGDAYRFDMTRPGIGLYGGMAFPDDAAARQTVARLSAPILQTRRLSAGDAIGYGASFTADHEMRIGIVGLGYGDGLPRSFGQFNPPRVRLGLGDREAAILGRISMDSFAIDLTDADDSIGADSMVEIFGDTTPIDGLAEQGQTISYELLTQLGSRYKRIYKT